MPGLRWHWGCFPIAGSGLARPRNPTPHGPRAPGWFGDSHHYNCFRGVQAALIEIMWRGGEEEEEDRRRIEGPSFNIGGLPVALFR
jgi:hypothetical protein